MLWNELHTKTLKAVSFAVLGIAAIIYASTYARDVYNQFPSYTFSVDASADVETTPDVAMFSASVITDGGKNVGEVQKMNTEKMNAINVYLGDQGIERKDLKTTQYNVSPRYSYCTGLNEPCTPTISGYSISQTLQIKVRDTNKLSDLLSGVVARGANNVSEISFVLDDDTAAKDTARAEAIRKAETKALATAKAAGFQLGRLVSLSESTPDAYQPIAYGMGGAALDREAVPAPKVEPGTQKTTVTVNLTYEIKR